MNHENEWNVCTEERDKIARLITETEKLRSAVWLVPWRRSRRRRLLFEWNEIIDCLRQVLGICEGKSCEPAECSHFRLEPIVTAQGASCEIIRKFWKIFAWDLLIMKRLWSEVEWLTLQLLVAKLPLTVGSFRTSHEILWKLLDSSLQAGLLLNKQKFP